MRISSCSPAALCLLVFASCSQTEPAQTKNDEQPAQKAGNANTAPTNGADSIGPLAIFEKRILPIFHAKKPSSCTECHLSGVDLKDYIHPEQERTFASLVNAGLIDTEKPDESKILTLIGRKPDKPNLITDKIRQQEYDAFRAWIRAAVDEPNLVASKSAGKIGPTVSDEVIRHARNDRVLTSFIDNIWSEVGRCSGFEEGRKRQLHLKGLDYSRDHLTGTE